MRLLVALKRVLDYNARVRVKPDKVCAPHLSLYESVKSNVYVLVPSPPIWGAPHQLPNDR